MYRVFSINKHRIKEVKLLSEERELKVKGVLITKEFDLYKQKSDKIKSLFKFWKNDIPTFWAVRGVNFEVYAGETVGIIGINGSGKSTLSNIISGVIPPTSGTLTINGETSIIAVSAGLKKELTGLENIRLKGLMQGMSNKEIDDKMQDIVDFADLGEFIDQPVKNYSSGMRSRLGFAIMAHNEPDILIIDEALSVGDATFYQKSLDKINEFKAQGKTIFFVSHSMSQIEAISDKIMWMHYGRLHRFGDAKDVLASYNRWVEKYKSWGRVRKTRYQQDRKDEQTAFSLDVLKEQIEEGKIVGADQLTEQEIKKNLIANGAGDKMPVTSKLGLIVIGLLWLFVVLVSLSGRSIADVYKHPVKFLDHFTERVIKRNSSEVDTNVTNLSAQVQITWPQDDKEV
jgi:teichoic acid transport system ATP-binding protein